ncbi:MAG: hypothetical protein C4562_04575 [Actinobacteria bacterium]|nr:MAG: hypothetical protein C4562_04575 [Actinomycetota bacterium]
MKKLALVLVICLILATSIAYATTLTWVATNNPSENTDMLSVITQDSSGYYIGGSDYSPGNEQWRLEKRKLTNGSLISSFGTGGVITNNISSTNDRIQKVIKNNGFIYIAGYVNNNYPTQSDEYWRVEKRNASSGNLVSSFGTAGILTVNPSSTEDELINIAIGNNYLYLVGFDNTLGNQQWRIEKRSLTDGSLINSFGTGGVVTSNPSSSEDQAYSIALDGSAIYVLGLDYNNSDFQWRLEKRSLSTGSLVSSFGSSGVVTVNPSNGGEYPSVVILDSSGLYTAGGDDSLGGSNTQYRIEKRNLTTGNLISSFGTGGILTVNPSTDSDGISHMLAVPSGLYLTGYDGSAGSGKSQWRIEKRSLTNGSLISSFGIGGVINRRISSADNCNDTANYLTLDSSGITVAGTDDSPAESDSQWRIERYADNTYLNTSLSLSARPRNLKRGSHTALKGQLKDSNKKKLSSQTIRFYKKALRITKKKVKGKIKTIKKWVWLRINIKKRIRITVKKKVNGKIKTYKKWVLRTRKYLTTDKNGKFAGYISPSNTAYFKAVFSGSFGYKPKSSKQIRVAVR